MGGAFHIAELDLVGGPRGADGYREGGLQQDLLLLPVGLGFEIDARRTAVDGQTLHDLRVQEAPDQVQDTPQRPVLFDRRLYQLVDRAHFLLVINVDVPGVEIHGLILERLQDVARRARFQHLALMPFVKQCRDLPAFI